MHPPPSPPARVRPRTSVVARPHVRVEGDVAAVAADDVDGAGSVDHGRVPPSRSPRRARRAPRPRDTCVRRARARPVAPNATTHAAAERIAGRAIDAARRHRATRCAGTAPRRTQTLARYTHAREDAIRWKCTNTHMRSQRHACTHGHARAHTNEHTHKRTRALHTHARARAPENRVEPSTPTVPPTVPPRYPRGTPVRTPPYRVGTASVPRRYRARALPSTR